MEIALLGFGTVGRSVYEMLTAARTPELEQIRIKKILVRRDIPGIERFAVRDFSYILLDPSIDTVVEVMGGYSPAYDYVKKALLCGKNVVTANKAMLARFYGEITELSEKSGAALLFEASCAGGIPWIKNLRKAKQTDRITRVGGILNGTANYILDLAQSEGLEPEAALMRAQMKGFAEADPSDDIDGIDTARKIAISANLAFDICISEASLLTAGIRNLSPVDIGFFKSRGLVCRLIAVAGKEPGGGVYAVTEPMLFKRSSPMASVPLNYNYAFLDGVSSGRLGFFGQGAGGPATANAIVQDLIEIAEGSAFKPVIKPFKIAPPPKKRYYIRAKRDIPALWDLPGERIKAEENEIILTTPVNAADVHALKDSAASADIFFASFAEDDFV
ncbi:MAG: Homoserine dehydrogenase [Firmicutes bacterium ADurb.Bin182]|nr:MAG: Homoserine dehydrogenase [Firmicutes bacterium ADurb.Bin182]